MVPYKQLGSETESALTKVQIEMPKLIKKAVRKLTRPLKRFIDAYKNRRLAHGKTKYFCIGRNKTGTTSLKKAFEDLGFPVGNQRDAELLGDQYYFKADFKPIIDYCESAQVFQDVPFSWPDIFKHLDIAYPESKFILTVRDSPEQWYQSMTKFHSKRFGDGHIPTIEQLKSARYVRKGFMYNTIKLHGTTDNDPYNKDIMMAHYLAHNQNVMDYFKDRMDDLLVINIAEKSSFQRFCKFINVKSTGEEFPWENKT